MPQQINLCSPILMTQKRYFSAMAMVQALSVFVVLGGTLMGAWVYNLKLGSDGMTQALAIQARELAGLQQAMQDKKEKAGPASSALAQEVQTRRAELQQRERMLGELRLGFLQPGMGHSARLKLMAQSIPANVWLAGLTADDGKLEINGYTLDPAALNEWVGRLSLSPLLDGQKLAAVKVDATRADAGKAESGKLLAGNANTVKVDATSASVQQIWSFSLVSAVSKPQMPVGVPVTPAVSANPVSPLVAPIAAILAPGKS
jgi:Tfp pilus assembly protein PilN